jgi:hypothetical protein
MPFIIIFSTCEEYPKDTNYFPVARYLLFFSQISRNLRKSGEPTWLRLAQGLPLSLPSLYGDRLTIGYLRLGERAIRAFGLSLGSGMLLCVESSSALFYRRAWKSSLSFPLRPTQMTWICIGTKFGFVWGFWI